MELKDLCRNGACSAVAASVQTMHLVGLKTKRIDIQMPIVRASRHMYNKLSSVSPSFQLVIEKARQAHQGPGQRRRDVPATVLLMGLCRCGVAWGLPALSKETEESGWSRCA